MSIESAHFETCHWLLRHPCYQWWLSPVDVRHHSGLLWINGNPGAGKSTIMKFAYRSKKREDHIDEAITASFFFDREGQPLQKSVMGMYRSLLLQLLEGCPDLQAVMEDMYQSLSPYDCPSFHTLQRLFRNVVLGLGNRSFTCFIDALDECEENTLTMVQYFRDLAEESRNEGVSFQVCFSACNKICDQGVFLALEEQSGHLKDLVALVKNRLHIGDSADSTYLLWKILFEASGNFRWAISVVNDLNREYGKGGMFLGRIIKERLGLDIL
ncbi:Pfs NACHT and ankyrin domain protein [Penicillium herquei]|nr:Pfs NACHT and ankyrin domain protein [Penicillium herquei]